MCHSDPSKFKNLDLLNTYIINTYRINEQRRKESKSKRLLFTASYTVGAVGLGAVIWPLVDQMNPDKAQQALATTEVDISQIEPGKSITVLWRGKPVFLKRRTEQEIAEARSVSLNDLPDPQKDEDRVKKGKEEWLVMLGVCTHLGCVPLKDKGDFKGWFCPCHGSHYDLSGRIEKDQLQLIWRFQNSNSLTTIQLKLDKNFYE